MNNTYSTSIHARLLGLLALLFCLFFQGCLETECDLLVNQDGSGKLDVRYVINEELVQRASVKAQMGTEGPAVSSPAVLIATESELRQQFRGDGIEVGQPRFETKDSQCYVSFSLSFTNLNTLLNTPALRGDAFKFFRNDSGNLAFQLDLRKALGGTEQFTSMSKNLADRFEANLRITLPSMVLENNADSIDDTILMWQYSKAKLTPEMLTGVCEGAGLPFLATLPAGAEATKGSSYAYNSEGRPDPFKPFILEARRIQDETAITSLNPLQRYDISQLKLVAVIWQLDIPTAMVEDSSGKGYIVTKGTQVGKNNGVVAEVGEKEVVVTEEFVNLLGETKSRDVRIKLHQEEREPK
ncbi:MAG TPA: pilus assembly protein PilP [Thermodesulfobacteriota bacterium]|nr:pilus assembly protein PilP [Deltaproteobacteria bacterium]HNR12490.1 pilus assembly protein PilP [Thermodesulfobacteriota bacterium]HNU70117.1 pilus assembly protein PilP [Thermodesulfobacteriota bacterium]HQO77481.1 pilus assembly protein PilP [Thermodesulfobacteriota bacterium]